MDLQELRIQIDTIDGELIRLFERRMDVSAEIAGYKMRHGLPVHDPEREKQKLCDLTQKTADRYKPYIAGLYSLIFELSRAEQEKLINLNRAEQEKLINTEELL